MAAARGIGCTLVLLLVCLVSAARYSAAQQGPALGGSVVKYTWTVTVGQRSPDCYSRPVILVNGTFQPTITVRQGDVLEVAVTNALPDKWPEVSGGISLHWHGFHLYGAEWYDGTAYVTQCPIPRGGSFTYRFRVNETPGTYFWHDHAALNRADGLQGALVVLPRTGQTELYRYDASRLLFLNDWWHFTGDSMAMRLNRPFDDAKVTNATGAWYWIGVPKAVLVNGKGRYADCEDVYTRKVGQRMANGAVATAADLMTPPSKAGALGATAAYPVCNVTTFSSKGCEHEVITVKPGSTTLLRLVNAATLVYMTVCVERHSVTLVALDGNPVTPRVFDNGCVDINSGQRADVLIQANQAVDNYWISVVSQYRKGAPAGYAVLSYEGARAKSLPGGNHSLVQPQEGAEKKIWDIKTTMSFKAHPALLEPAKNARASAPYILPLGVSTQRLPKKDIDRRFVFQSTQPLLEANGILRWALDNAAHAKAPPCDAVADLVLKNPNWAAANAIRPAYNGLSGYFEWAGSANNVKGDNVQLQVVDASANSSQALLKANKPGAATHVLTLPLGQMVELVVQNNRAGRFGGEYAGNGTNARGGREQHPFHLHGHRFWLVGTGNGTWTESKVAEYNLVDPVMRDTGTVFFDGPATQDTAGWVALRFLTDNPGVWPFHCHITWHQFMGQQVNIIEGNPANFSARPADLPACRRPCIFNEAKFPPKYALETTAPAYLAPANASLP